MDRRDFQLQDHDLAFLNGLGKRWEAIQDGSQWILIHDFTLPDGYTHAAVILAIRIESGYPMSQLDMMYLHPSIQRKDGKQIGAAEVIQPINQTQFQRWSRHRTGENPWKPGEDSLETHYYFIEDALRAELQK